MKRCLIAAGEPGREKGGERGGECGSGERRERDGNKQEWRCQVGQMRLSVCAIENESHKDKASVH